MQLSPGERTLLAYFPTTRAARRAAAELRNLGFDKPQIDRVSRYGVNNDANINNPINMAITETGPTLFSSNSKDLSDTERVLLAADPSVSGIGAEDYGIAGSTPFLLTLVTNEKKAGQAEEVIKKHGGKL